MIVFRFDFFVENSLFFSKLILFPFIDKQTQTKWLLSEFRAVKFVRQRNNQTDQIWSGPRLIMMMITDVMCMVPNRDRFRFRFVGRFLFFKKNHPTHIRPPQKCLHTHKWILTKVNIAVTHTHKQPTNWPKKLSFLYHLKMFFNRLNTVTIIIIFIWWLDQNITYRGHGFRKTNENKKKQKNWVTEPDRWLNITIIYHLKASRMIFSSSFWPLTLSDLVQIFCLSGQRLTWRKEQYGPTITWQVFFAKQRPSLSLISFIYLFICQCTLTWYFFVI